MLKLTLPEDCDNAPKKRFIKEFNIAFMENNIQKISDSMADDITWNMVGTKQIQGKTEAMPFLEQMVGSKGNELIIHNIITHGKHASANGIMKFEDGSTIAFCDVYTFTGHDANAKIKELTSYAVEL